MTETAPTRAPHPPPPAELSPGSFVYALPEMLRRDDCGDIIERFEASPAQQYTGRAGQSGAEATSVKRSTDLRVSGREDWSDVDALLCDSLTRALGGLAALHPFFAHNRFKDTGYNLQRTNAGEFYHWHVDSGPGHFSQRQLVAIWYLNDVSGPGGETEFYHQQVSVRPTCGTLLLFPPFWTHLHRGATVRDGVKYIATTWVSFQ